jgi:iron complex transport system ATP-binding protein
MMDEPAANLDFGNQMRVLAHVRVLVASGELAVLMTSHDPNQALLHAHRVAALGRDGTVHAGAPADIITASYLQAVYGVGVQVAEVARPGGGVARFCLPVAAP